MVFLVCIGVKAFEFISFLIAFLAKEEVKAILTHPAPLIYQLFAVEALVFFLFVELRLEYCFEFVVCFVRL